MLTSEDWRRRAAERVQRSPGVDGSRPRLATGSCAAIAGLTAALLTLQGCASLPKDGPTGAEVRASAEVHVDARDRVGFALVKLTPEILRGLQLGDGSGSSLNRLARLSPATEVRVARSDTLSMSIFEASPGGLFVPAEAGSRPGNFVQIPPQEVDQNGDVSVPYGGTIHALGKTPRQIEQEIVARLKVKAIEPQVIVTVGERTANAVSVLGDVTQPTSIPMKPGGLRLLNAIARAGGSRYPAHSSVVTVQRKGRIEKALLLSVLNNPSENIQLAPEDVVSVENEPRIFMAFGATGDIGTQTTIGLSTSNTTNTAYSRRYVIDREQMTLAEALAVAGGAVNDRADPRSVFLFRYAPAALLQRLGVDTREFSSAQVPTVFSIDLSQVDGYFIANHFFMNSNDMIYISDAPAVDLVKFLNVVGAVTTTARGTIGVAADVKTLSQ